MRIKFVSLLILGLCLLSIIVGLLNFNKVRDVKKSCPVESKTALLKGFSGGTDKIALITLQGTISYNMSSSFFGDFESAQGALTALTKAFEDEKVKGVIFRINSPGGTVGMSQELYNAVLRLRKEKPVIVSMADVAASGGYYVACAADRIYANPGTLTGSIGVIMETINAQGLFTDKLGVKSEIIKSGKFKDTGSIYRPLREDERELLNELVNNAYGQFVNAIITGRVNRKDEYKLEKAVLTEENLKKYADGRIFTGTQGLEYGFVDKLGGLAIVKKDIITMAKEKFPEVSDKTPVVNYNKPSGFGDFFFNMSNKIAPQMNSFESIIPASKKYARQPLFIWE